MVEPVIIGDCQLYLGECQNIIPLLAKSNHVITDPPYGDKTHKGARSLKGTGGGHNPIDFDCVDVDFIRYIFSMAAPQRWLVSFIEWRHCFPLEENPPEGLEFIRMGVWVKSNPMPQLTGDRPGTGWEAIAILHPAGKKVWNGGGASAVWNHGTSRHGYFGPSAHPTEKPMGLLNDIVKKFTDHGETVLDPFMGSGTTGVACIKLKRKFIGIERDPKYFETACKRIEDFYKQPDMFIEPPAKLTQEAMPL